MGEAKRKRDKMTDYEKFIQELTRKLADEGKLIEAGWAELRGKWLPQDAPPNQVKDLRWAFMAGAQHVFHSMTTMVSEGDGITAEDERRMMLIGTELEAFAEEMVMSLPTEGSA